MEKSEIKGFIAKRWAIEKIRREFMSCIEDAAVEQILNSIQQ